MKIYLLCIILLAYSCTSTPKLDYALLIGTRTSELQADSTFDVHDKMIFKTNDSVLVEVTVQGQQSLSSSGIYSVDKEDGTLKIKTDSFERTSKILDLNRNSLVLQLPKGLWRLKRVN